MADGAFNVELSEYTASKLVEKAKTLGLAPEALAADILDRLLDDSDSPSRPSTRPEDYDGPYVELEEALSAFDHELERRLANRAE